MRDIAKDIMEEIGKNLDEEMMEVLVKELNEEMEPRYRLDVTSTKSSLDLFNISDILNPVADDYDNIIYDIFISMYEVDEHGEDKSKAFEATLTVFSDLQDINEVLDQADELGQDEYDYVNNLLDSDEFNRDLYNYEEGGLELTWGINIVSGALHRFYVYPAYRKLGIGKNIINSIDKIVERALNIKLRCLVTCPKPDDGQEDGMLSTMINHIENNGFRKIANGNKYYVRDYIEEYFEYEEE